MSHIWQGTQQQRPELRTVDVIWCASISKAYKEPRKFDTEDMILMGFIYSAFTCMLGQLPQTIQVCCCVPCSKFNTDQALHQLQTQLSWSSNRLLIGRLCVGSISSRSSRRIFFFRAHFLSRVYLFGVHSTHSYYSSTLKTPVILPNMQVAGYS